MRPSYGDRIMIKRTVHKIARKAKPVITIWRYIVAIILFVIIYPTFLATHTKDNFYIIVLLVTVVVLCIAFVVERALNPKYRSFIVKARYLMLSAAVLLAIAAYVPMNTTPIWKMLILLASAFLYALAAQRLGLGIFVAGV